MKTPINENFHQRQVTLPCALEMRKGVKDVVLVETVNGDPFLYSESLYNYITII